MIVVLVFFSFLNLLNRIKEYINENKFACFILLITFLIFLFNLFSFIVINKNYFLSDLRFIFSNFLTVFLCFYFFIFFKNEKFQIFSNGKAIRLLILLGLIMSMIIVTNSQTFKVLVYDLSSFLQNSEKIANEILFKDNFKILDEHVNIYFKVDYPLNSKFVIISILNFFFFFLFYKKKKKILFDKFSFFNNHYFYICKFLCEIDNNFIYYLFIYSQFLLKIFDKSFNYNFNFFSGFILYQKKTAEILNMNLNKFQEYYHFNIKNEFKTKCDVTVEFYNDKKINL